MEVRSYETQSWTGLGCSWAVLQRAGVGKREEEPGRTLLEEVEPMEVGVKEEEGVERKEDGLGETMGTLLVLLSQESSSVHQDQDDDGMPVRVLYPAQSSKNVVRKF